MKTELKVNTTNGNSTKSAWSIKCLSARYTDKESLIRGLLSNAFLFVQALIIIAAYAVLAYFYTPFFYFSLAATLLCIIYSCFRFEGMIRTSWICLLLLSFGFGYIAFLMSQKEIIFYPTRKKFIKVLSRSPKLDGTYIGGNSFFERDKAQEYLQNVGGFPFFTNNKLTYFADAHAMFEDIFLEIERAKKFIFIETFIICDGLLFDRLMEVLFRKIDEGVKVYLIYDSGGCQRMLTKKSEKLLKSGKINTVEFKPMFNFFHIAQNFRDHRKIFIVDGKCAYIGGSNIDDECANLLGLDLRWRDNALKISGSGVDSVSHMFIRQWEMATSEQLDYALFSGTYELVNNPSIVQPYASGVEVKRSICHGLYLTMIETSKKLLYISSPYFVPDKKIYRAVKEAAQRGVEVRLILPEVADYSFVYRVTKSYAESLIKYGVKVYYVADSFMHSKTVLNESGVSIGSANLDMRSFFEEYDNGVYTDDINVRAEVLSDLNAICEQTPLAVKERQNIFLATYVALLKLFSPLM